MSQSILERQVESAVQDMFDDRVVRVVKSISKMAAKQGGESAVHNYRLLGKRALIALGAAIVTVQVVTSAVGFVVSRRTEEQRIERIVRRVLEEERQKEQA